MIKLGDRVREDISGYEGVVVARSEYLWGCVTYWVKAEGLDKDGKPHEGEWFDAERLTPVRAPSKPLGSVTGGPCRPVPLARHPVPPEAA